MLHVLAAAGVAVLAIVCVPTEAAAVDNGMRFAERSLLASESDGLATIDVRRAATAALEVSSVDYRSEDVDALGGDDYESVRGRLTMGVGQATAKISVYVFDDIQTEGEERFALVLADTEDPDRVLDRLIVSVSDNDGVRAKWGYDDEGDGGAASGVDPAAAAAASRRREAAAAAAQEAARRRSSASVPARSSRVGNGAGTASSSSRSARVTPFQLQPPVRAAGAGDDPGPVAVLAVVAAASLALVLARLWFRWRLTLEPD